MNRSELYNEPELKICPSCFRRDAIHTISISMTNTMSQCTRCSVGGKTIDSVAINELPLETLRAAYDYYQNTDVRDGDKTLFINSLKLVIRIKEYAILDDYVMGRKYVSIAKAKRTTEISGHRIGNYLRDSDWIRRSRGNRPLWERGEPS
jgi:hypothetical protein